LFSACIQGQPCFEAVEAILKGKEAKLPEGVTFIDKDGHERDHIRVKWFEKPGATFGEYSMEPIECDESLPEAVKKDAVPYPHDGKPVFVGHYWFRGTRPELLRHNVACVDWSVAKGGFLCAYRWNGEAMLSNENFVWVKATSNPSTY
jgi:hypothetical protein